MSAAEIRALVIDDDSSWQGLLRELLTDMGLVVDVASTLEQASTLIRAESHRIAVVDLSLNQSDHHNQDGLRILDAIRRYDPGCLAILLTGYATVEIAVNALTERGAYTCLRKESFSRSSFRTLLNQALTSPVQQGAILEMDAPTTPSIAKTAAPADATKGTALVVDDDGGWRSILAELLQEAGYKVRQCNGFGEAMGCLGRERFDLAVVDLSLSGSVRPSAPVRTAQDAEVARLDGLRLLATARASGVPTIVVSGMGNPQEIERTYSEYGIFSYLEKQTFDRGAFLRTVADVPTSTRGDGELDQLTDRERQVLGLLAHGMTNKEIAETLVISPNTVKRHLKAIFAKLGIRTRAAAVTRAMNAGLTTWTDPDSTDAALRV